jgi:hypothetical protein
MVDILLLVDIRPIFDQLASGPSRSGSEPHHSDGSVQDLLGDARDVARAVAATPEYAKACRRREKVEMLFAHLKRTLRLAEAADLKVVGGRACHGSPGKRCRNPRA